jgi:transposase
MGGVESLRRRPASGRPPKLAPEHVRRLPELLNAGVEVYGFRGQVWTTKRIAHLMGLRLGVRYHPAHVSRLLRVIGWSVQQPIQRATQRNEGAIKTWREKRWPALQKTRPALFAGKGHYWSLRTCDAGIGAGNQTRSIWRPGDSSDAGVVVMDAAGRRDMPLIRAEGGSVGSIPDPRHVLIACRGQIL